MNRVKNVDPLKRPHMGRVTGAGHGRKHANHGLAEPSTKESRQEAREERKRQQNRDTEVLRNKLDTLEASIPQRVDDAVAKRVNELMPTVIESLAAYFAGDQQGPVPVISLGGSNSHNMAPREESAPRENAPVVTNFVTPAVSNPRAREDSPLVAVASSPSVTCMPIPGPSTLAELDALTVMN